MALSNWTLKPASRLASNSIACIVREPGPWAPRPIRPKHGRLIICHAHSLATSHLRICFEPECESHREVRRLARVIAHQERKRPGPASEVAKDGIVLLSHVSRARVEPMGRPQSPVRIYLIYDRAVEEILAGPQRGWRAAQIAA